MILGPETTVAAVGRPVISVTPTHKKLSSLAATDLENGERDYQEGRKAWLARSQGRLIEFQPLRRSTLARGVEGSSIGFRYRIGARDFQEFSYTVVCAGELYHLKTLTREAQGRSIASEVEKAVRSFECK